MTKCGQPELYIKLHPGIQISGIKITKSKIPYEETIFRPSKKQLQTHLGEVIQSNSFGEFTILYQDEYRSYAVKTWSRGIKKFILTWFDRYLACQEIGGTLFLPNSHEELRIVFQHVLLNKIFKGTMVTYPILMLGAFIHAGKKPKEMVRYIATVTAQ